MSNKRFIDLPALSAMTDSVIIPVSDGLTKKLSGSTLSTYALSKISADTVAASGSGGSLTYSSGTGIITFTPALNIQGNAATATKLAASKNINGVAFDGTVDITVEDATKLPLAGGTMTGNISFAATQPWPIFNQSTTGNAATATYATSAGNGGVTSVNGMTGAVTIATGGGGGGGSGTGAVGFEQTFLLMGA